MPGKERDAVRTRRLVLDAAAAAVTENGAGVSLDRIARSAGVSKSGLLHHFSSREKLLLALAEDLVAQFRAAVERALDPADHGRGRLIRAYVNATVDDLLEDSTARYFRLMASLAAVPGVAELMERDNARWDAEFADDGLHPERALLIVRAADGATVAGLYEGRHEPEDLETLRRTLLTLSAAEGPLA
ncbi:TetR/AcrR family transcriptional regulator [Kineococcus sp. SYSU DK003]|uniref:TetR/AcrR family transcriptional regulator n=1 Tax=Kineococcus sp. SYSU DK003 TaxID=3383124 RepID=UPI003D7C8C07